VWSVQSALNHDQSTPLSLERISSQLSHNAERKTKLNSTGNSSWVFSCAGKWLNSQTTGLN